MTVALRDCSAGVAELAGAAAALAVEGVLECGLLAGERPAADVTVLLAAAARVEAVLALRMALAEDCDALPFPRSGDMAMVARWTPKRARALSRAGALANGHPALAELWLTGVITVEHVDAIALGTTRLTHADVAALVGILIPALPELTPADVSALCARTRALLHPPDPHDPDPAATAFDQRHLSFAVQGDVVHLCGMLPRLEGELLVGALRATAASQRVAGDGLTAAQRRADALILLATGEGTTAPLSVTVLTTGQAHTAGGHPLSPAETAHLGCSATFTPVLVSLLEDALATPQPLNLGRTVRLATPAQRRALAVRDGGCVVPGCAVPPRACQAHHITAWEAGGTSDMSNMALLCWAHHRQVDLGRWDIQPATDDHPVAVTVRPRQRWQPFRRTSPYPAPAPLSPMAAVSLPG